MKKSGRPKQLERYTVYEVEKFILLKYPYKSKQSADSVQTT